MIAVEYLSDLRKACADPAIGALPAAAGAPFDRADWWEGLVRHCGLTPLYGVARGGGGVALVPLARVGKGVSAPLANWYSFRWRPLVSPGGDAPALLTALFRDLARSHWRLSLDHMPDEDGSATMVAAALRDAGWRVSISQDDINYILPVAGRPFAQYLDARPGSVRSTLKRKAGRVACEVLSHYSDEAWAAYETVYAASWKGEEGTPAFLRAFAEAEGEAGRLRLGIARADGKPVAAQVWTVEAGTAFIHKLAYREDARALSPGTVLTAALMARVIDKDRVDLVDFGTGDDAYKRDWMEQARPRFRVLALKPADPRAWTWLAGKALRRLAPAAWRR